jgi:hypothetical protein
MIKFHLTQDHFIKNLTVHALAQVSRLLWIISDAKFAFRKMTHGAGRVAQVVEHLSSKRKHLSSKPVLSKKKKKKKTCLEKRHSEN